MKRVTPIPRQCWPTWRIAPKSTFNSIGMIISQISTATGRFTRATSSAPNCANAPGNMCPRPVPTAMHTATHKVR